MGARYDHITSAMGLNNCSPTAWLAPLIVCVTILTSLTIRFARLRYYKKKQAEGDKPRDLPTWSFEKAAMLVFCMPKLVDIYRTFTNLEEATAASMWANVHLGSESAFSAFWFVGYIAALETLDHVAMKRAKAVYQRSLLAQEEKQQTETAPTYMDEKTPLVDVQEVEEEDPTMDQEMTIYEAARMPLPAPRKTTTTITTEETTTCEGTCERRTFRQRLAYILSAPSRKYIVRDRATTAASIVASYNFSIFLRTLMLYITLSVAALSLCGENPVSYLNATESGCLKWVAIAAIYAFRIFQLNVGCVRFEVRQRIREMMEQGIRLV